MATSRLLDVPRSRSARSALVTALAVALVVGLLSGPPPRRAEAAAPSPIGGFSLHGGLGGKVDERTGQLAVSVPLTEVRGDGQSGVSLALSWQQSRSTQAVDRSGWGAGWSLSTSFVDVTGLKRVFPAGGGSYFLDPAEPSGLKNYELEDLQFVSRTGILPRRSGAAQVSFAYVLSYQDGRTDYFDVNGNLAARTDRFGNRTDLTWRPRANNVWQPTSVVDSYGLATTFDYSVANRVSISSPTRSDGVRPVTTITSTAASGVQSVTDPVGQTTGFSYTSISGASKPLLTMITAPTGARSVAGYASPSYQSGLVVVSTLKLTDAAGTALSPTQTFDVNPAGNNRHNFTGYPNHLGAGGQDALFASGDTAYTYTTALTTGSTTTTSTYDALHRLVRRAISVVPAAGQLPVTAQTHQLSYPTAVVVPALLTPNFAHPTRVALTESAATSAQGLVSSPARTTATTTAYDDHGRLVSATDALGTTTTTAYDDRFGLVTRQTTTGADGSRAEVVNELTDDGRNIASSVTSVGEDEQALSARQVYSYSYDDDGRISQRRLGWAPGAEPDDDEPGGGPDEIITSFDRSVDTDDGTLTLTTTTAAGTDAAQQRTVEIDLVSGQAVRHTDGLGRDTTFTFDAAGRQTKVVTPDGQVTTTAYSPTQTTVTGADGRITRSTTDLLGRTVAITDNVRNRALVTDPGARTLTAATFSADGGSVTATDQTGRKTTTTLDAFGRTVRRVGPTGLTHLVAFDDGADNQQVASVLPAGSDDPQMSTTTAFDDLGRAVRSDTAYLAAGAGEPTEGPATSATFDGLGQPTTSTGNDLAITTDRSAAVGGVATEAVATPVSDDLPGGPITAVTTRSLAGAATSRTLQQDDEVSAAMAMTYDAAGNVTQATDPEGRTWRYGYTPDGRPSSKTDPSGTVTTQRYDQASGLLASVTVTAPGRPDRTISYTRVPNGQPGAGQVKTVSDGTDTLTYGYDVDGHRTSVGYPDGTSTSSSYNDKGQLISTTDVTGAVTSYVHDPDDGTLTSATQRRGATVLASVGYTYDPMGRIATTKRGNGILTTHTYTGSNMLASQSTTDAGGRVIESHRYTYDAHRNPVSRTDTYLPGGSAAVPGATATSWTTVYRYDAYDRLIGSAVHAGGLTDGQPTGPPSTSTSYTVDLGGDVVSTTTTRRLPGVRPISTTTTSTNTIDDSGRLTAQRTGTSTRTQTFDDDGRVTKSLDGITTTYATDGSPASITLADGTTTTRYASWPDGSRRSATTTDADGVTSAVTYHYGPDGLLLNDSTSDSSTVTGQATTASYLLTTGREARTLLPGTATSGKVTGTPAAPLTQGAGNGYYLRDRHTSVTGMVDSAGATSASYAYTDYGAPARADGQPTTRGLLDGGRTNPFTYLGAAPRGPRTEAAVGLVVYPERSYNPQQGRFTSMDPVDAHNRYQGFNTNPIVYVDLSGQMSTLDIVLDCVFAVVFIASFILTAGAAAAAIGAIGAAVEAGVAVTAGLVANAAATTIGATANLIGAVTGTWLAADDLSQATGHGKLLTDDGRAKVSMVTNIVTAVAGVTGVVQGFTDAAVSAVRASTAAANAASAAKVAAADAALSAESFEQEAVLMAKEGQVGTNPVEVVPENQVLVPEVVPPENNAAGGAPAQENNPVNLENNPLEPNNQQVVEGGNLEGNPNQNQVPQERPQGPPQQTLDLQENRTTLEVLPGNQQQLNIGDLNLVLNNPSVPASMEVTNTAERMIERSNTSPPNPNADHVTEQTTVPHLPNSDRPTENFTTENTHLLKT